VSDRLHMLVALQDLDLMILEVRDPAGKEKEEALGFAVNGLAELEKARLAVLKKIPVRDLRLYERMRGKYDRVVVPVRSRICLGCFQALPTKATRAVAEDGPLPTCESCGRILYWL
jgi:predicted  nucleic acid-binding Zn-ribbon protein